MSNSLPIGWFCVLFGVPPLLFLRTAYDVEGEESTEVGVLPPGAAWVVSRVAPSATITRWNKRGAYRARQHPLERLL